MDPFFPPWVGPNGEVPEPPRFSRGTLIIMAMVFAIYLGVMIGGVSAFGVFNTIALTLILMSVVTLVLVTPLIWGTWYRYGSTESNYPPEKPGDRKDGDQDAADG